VSCFISLYRPISALALRKLCELGFFLTAIFEKQEMPVPMGNPQARNFQRKENQLSQSVLRGNKPQFTWMGDFSGRQNKKEDQAVSKIERAGIRPAVSILG
jgi:hypothetical protein